MRFLAFENFPLAVIHALREHGHDVTSIWESARGSDDEAVLARAQHEQSIVVTFDQDFGELAFRRGLAASCGIVLFRIQAHDPTLLAHRILNVLHSQPDWRGVFASVDEERIRSRSLPLGPSSTA